MKSAGNEGDFKGNLQALSIHALLSLFPFSILRNLLYLIPAHTLLRGDCMLGILA